ncbi:hypothetical protein ABT160_41995 [Streptomyces sp. NPDC001941]|uniref:hypothetical protein n=1 Tax=Streptomyces sp. NPDC001941 TaxID=3154659 RepID=UPI00332E673E
MQALAKRLDGPEADDTWFGYPPQKHFVHLSQAYTLLGDTQAACTAQDEALYLTTSPSVMTRALISVDTATCLRNDGAPSAAADMAAGVYDRLPVAYREGLIRSRTQALHQSLTGRARDLLGQALARVIRRVLSRRFSEGPAHGGPRIREALTGAMLDVQSPGRAPERRDDRLPSLWVAAIGHNRPWDNVAMSCPEDMLDCLHSCSSVHRTGRFRRILERAGSASVPG